MSDLYRYHYFRIFYAFRLGNNQHIMTIIVKCKGAFTRLSLCNIWPAMFRLDTHRKISVPICRYEASHNEKSATSSCAICALPQSRTVSFHLQYMQFKTHNIINGHCGIKLVQRGHRSQCRYILHGISSSGTSSCVYLALLCERMGEYVRWCKSNTLHPRFLLFVWSFPFITHL